MIKLDIQLFAKSAAWARESRKSKAKLRFYEEEKKKESEPKEKSKQEKKQTPGEAVTAVSMREQYEIYRIDNGKEIPVIRDGAQVIRTGREVMEKFYYDKNRKGWFSKAKGLRYRIRKKQ